MSTWLSGCLCGFFGGAGVALIYTGFRIKWLARDLKESLREHRLDR